MIGVYGSDFVCAACIADEGIGEFIATNADSDTCSFCGATSSESIAASLVDVADYMERCINRHYDDPVNWLSYETADGGYIGITFSTDELLLEELDLVFPNDNDNQLLEAIADQMGTDLWCEVDPFRLNPADQLNFSWDSFCELIKHKRRYFFLSGEERGADEEIFGPTELLERIFSFAERYGLFVPLPIGAQLFRTRGQKPGERYTTAHDLGPPPVENAIQTNRMSPPGIVMMYASGEVYTALAETADHPGSYAVGEFETMREVLVLDLTRVARAPSIFETISDSLECDTRPALLFLHHIADDISRPIARDDRVHIEYVPTQVVTKYLRMATTVDGRRIEGVRYQSARNHAGSSIVLFADQNNLILPESEQLEMYGLHKDRWLRLKDSTVYMVTVENIALWAKGSRLF